MSNTEQIKDTINAYLKELPIEHFGLDVSDLAEHISKSTPPQEHPLLHDVEEAAKDYIRFSEKYFSLLTEELNEVVGMAAHHGWESARFDEGRLLRAQIDIAKESLLKAGAQWQASKASVSEGEKVMNVKNLSQAFIYLHQIVLNDIKSSVKGGNRETRTYLEAAEDYLQSIHSSPLHVQEEGVREIYNRHKIKLDTLKENRAHSYRDNWSQEEIEGVDQQIVLLASILSDLNKHLSEQPTNTQEKRED